MAPTKTVCKNSEKFSFTGKEMSPLGLGYCADAESVGTEMVGRDGKNWIVGVKNNDKIWMRAPEKALAPEEPLLQKEAEADAPAEEKPVEKKPKSKSPKKEEEKPAETNEEEKPADTTEEVNSKPAEEKPVEKPKRKYTKKTKTTPSDEDKTEETDGKVKKERKKRGPSGYNLFIGKTMKELREKKPGQKTTDYMKEAQETWGAMSKEQQKQVGEELKGTMTVTAEA